MTALTIRRDRTPAVLRQLFVEKGCSGCRRGINVAGEAHFPFGAVEKQGAKILPLADRDRLGMKKTADDQYVYRAAPLRSVDLRAPYFHSGKVWSLKQAAANLAKGEMGHFLPEPVHPR